MGAHLGKNTNENDKTELEKNVIMSFHNVDFDAVELLWKTFLNGESSDFIMDKNTLTDLFDKWQTDGIKTTEEDSWFNSATTPGKSPVAPEDILETLPHYIHKFTEELTEVSENKEGEENKEDNSSSSSNNSSAADDHDDGSQKSVGKEIECVDIMEIIFTILIYFIAWFLQ